MVDLHFESLHVTVFIIKNHNSVMKHVNCSYVYVPILPAPLYEVLNTPTPFIAGVHSSLADDTADLVC